MNSKSKKNQSAAELLYYILGFMPLFVTFFIYPDIPNKIAFQYNFLGEVSELESKQILLIVPLLLSVFTYVNPKFLFFKYNVDFEDKVSYYSTILFMSCVNLLIYIQIYISLKGTDFLTVFNLYHLLSCGICIMSIYFGALLTRGPRNCSFCVKVSTYFMDDLSWKLFHNHLGSYLTSSALVFLPISIFCTSKYIFVFLMAEILLMVLLPIIWAYIYLKRYKKIN